MCGLVGILAKHQSGFFTKDADIFKQLLYADAVRGWDATGIMGVDKIGNIDIKKQASAAGHFLLTKQYNEFEKKIISDYRMIIGHNRKATHGEKRHEDAHPFWDKEEKICLVHNGMIRNHKEFCKESTVDSAAIANALATRDRMEVLSEVEGAFVFIWYDVEEKAIYFIKNSERPLSVVETNSTYILSSEYGLASWIASRNKEEIKATIKIEDMHLYKFQLEERKIIDEGVIQKKSRSFQQTTTTTQTPNTGAIINYSSLAYDDHDKMFLVTTDLKEPADVMSNINCGDVLAVKISSYEEKANGLARLDLEMINVKREWLKIHSYITKDIFDQMDLLATYKFEARSIFKQGDEVLIYGTNLSKTDSKTTINDVTITEDMWFNDIMPCECSICNDKVFWGSIEKSNILLSNLEVDVFICPKCSSSEKEANV